MTVAALGATGDLLLRLPVEPATETPKGDFSGWVWPMGVFQDQEPVWTGNSWGPDHWGSDLAYLNWLVDLLPQNYPEVYGGLDGALGHNRYFVPTGKIPALAVGPGRVWFAGETEWGWTVRIDHGDHAGILLNSYVTHMSRMFVDPWPGKGGGQPLYAGQEIGIVGEGPTERNHVHLELWEFGVPNPTDRPGLPLDPRLYLPHFGRRVIS